MVRERRVARAVTDHRVIAALRDVPRSLFVPAGAEDGPGSTTSPVVVAVLAEAACVRPPDRVLEIGTGSGYGAAILARLAAEVHSVERRAHLASDAARRLVAAGATQVTVHVGDGRLGVPEHAPFDAIVVTAAAAEVPTPLLEQLAVGGRLVIPVGRLHDSQTLVRITRCGERTFRSEPLGPVRFVPLAGDDWP